MTIRAKAFYADPNLVDFVRPGLSVKITSASIAPDGTIQAQFTVSDPKGLPLDRAGTSTPGAVSTSFIASRIPSDQNYYVAYTTTTDTGNAGTVDQPAADTGGTYAQNAPGQYTYTFRTKASNFDPGATTAIGVYSSRDLSEFGLGTNFADNVFTFVPNGSAITKTHEVIRTETCNKCHDPLFAHGGARRSMELCVLCHTQPAIDAQSGNSIQFKQMIHKIHQGAELPSVQAGHPYQVIGFRGAVNDWSDVEFPADIPGEGARNCQFCHESGAPSPGGTPPPGSTTPSAANPPPDAKWWLTQPTIEACGSCHDDVNFATGENHAGGPQISNNQCAACHIPQGQMPFDASIIGAHTIPRFAPGLPGVVFTLESVTSNSAGQSPVVNFTLKDRAGNPLQASQMNLLNLVIAGPTTDYASVVSEDARQAQPGAGPGTFTYTFKSKIAADDRNTYSIGIEGYKNVTLLAGTAKQMTVRDVGQNQVINFSSDGSPVAPHAVEVTTEKCNACHYQLAAHGTIRNQIQHCLLCHNPNATDAGQRPVDQGPPQTIDFPVMSHRIHSAGGLGGPTGENVEGPYVVYGFGRSRNDFSNVRFPGELRDCEQCHVNNSQQVPPPAGHLPVVNPSGFINPEGPATAACMGCHNSQETAAHAEQLGGATSRLGESCGVCHGVNAEFSVNKVHARENP